MKRHSHFIRLLPLFMATIALLISFRSISQVKEEWVRKYNNSAAAGIKLDHSENIYVAGRGSLQPGDVGFLIFKYNSQGDQLWARDLTFDGGAQTADLATDKKNNVYVTGTVVPFDDDNQDTHFGTVKYDSNGTRQWFRDFNGPIQFGYDLAFALTADNSENVYVTGSIEFHGRVMTTIKYNKSGDQQWKMTNANIDGGFAVQSDTGGNIYVLGANFYRQPEYLLVKYGPDGSELWAKQIALSSKLITPTSNSLAIDDSANLYIAGSNEGHFLVAKYNKDGILQWTRSNDEPVGYARSVSVDRFGNVFVTGEDTAHERNERSTCQTVKYNLNGVRQWIKEFKGSSETSFLGFVNSAHITVDLGGSAYIAAGSNGDNGLADYVAIKYSPEGDQQWIQHYTIPEHNWLIPDGIVVDSSGAVYVSGQSGESADGIPQSQAITTIKYLQTIVQFGVCCFDNGFGPQAKCGSNVTPLNCSKSGKDAFFAGSVNDCSLIDTATLCGKTPSIVRIDAAYIENEHSIKVSWERKESSPITGYYVQRSSDGISFKSIGFMPVNTSGNYIFTDPYPEIENYYKLVWFEKNGHESNKVLAVVIRKDRMQLLPNPATNKVRVILKDADRYDSRLTITDNTGRIKLSQRITKSTRPELDVSNLSSGIYFIRVEQNGKVYREKLVKQ